MARKSRIDWGSPEVLSVITDDTLGLDAKSKALGIKKYWLCRQMKRLGIKHNLYWRSGLNRPLTNKERKARYNAKRKAIGWKYLYQVK